MVRRKDTVIPIPMPVHPQRRHQIGYTIQKLKRREIHDAIRAGPRGRVASASTNPVCGQSFAAARIAPE